MQRSVFCAVVACAFSFVARAEAQQKFYVDFDTVKDAYEATPGLPGLPPADEIHDYSPAFRGVILGYLNARYEQHGMLFLEGPKPVLGVDSGITLNSGFGAGAEKIDFRNLDHHDNGNVNAISILKFLGAGSWDDDLVAIATANLVGHEAEHLMGVRHHDALGPIGSGLGGGILPGDFNPPYPGPVEASDTGLSITSLHAGGSLSLGSLTTPKYVSERAAVRIYMGSSEGDSFHTVEVPTGNHSVATAQFVPTPLFDLPYPFRPPAPPGEPIPVALAGFAATVEGTFNPVPDLPTGSAAFFGDYFKFFGMAGQRWTIEGMSYILDNGERYADNADVAMLLLDDVGVVLPYYGSPFARNDDDDEDSYLGAMLLDVVLPYTGEYIIELIASGPHFGTGKMELDGGSYELFLYTARTIAVPELSTLNLLLMALLSFVGRRSARVAAVN